MSRPVLLLQLGEAPEVVVRVHGTFSSWYERAFAERLHIHDGRPGGRGPEPRDFAGMIITGSSASLSRPEPWMDDACDLVVRAADAGVPVLGVCFGHQLVGRAFGAAVTKNPRGWEIGTGEVGLTDAGRRDPLFTGLAPTLRVNLTHEDHVEPGAAELEALAGNAHTPLQAVAAGPHVRGIQFHPEMTGAIIRSYIAARRPVLTGLDPDALSARAADCPDGIAIFANFRRAFVARA
jgi:GMP synthase (glutamine-hydrolysing)